MNMEHENPSQTRNPNPGNSRPAPRRSPSKGGRYLKEPPQKPNATSARRRRRRRRKLNPRFVIMLAVLLALLIGLLFILRSCNKPDITGRWDMDGNTFYRFADDGTGVMETQIKEYEFTYAIDDNELHIDFADEGAKDLKYTFELEKDTLFLTGGPGDAKTDYALKRVG